MRLAARLNDFYDFEIARAAHGAETGQQPALRLIPAKERDLKAPKLRSGNSVTDPGSVTVRSGSKPFPH